MIKAARHSSDWIRAVLPPRCRHYCDISLIGLKIRDTPLAPVRDKPDSFSLSLSLFDSATLFSLPLPISGAARQSGCIFTHMHRQCGSFCMAPSDVTSVSGIQIRRKRPGQSKIHAWATPLLLLLPLLVCESGISIVRCRPACTRYMAHIILLLSLVMSPAVCAIVSPLSRPPRSCPSAATCND